MAMIGDSGYGQENSPEEGVVQPDADGGLEGDAVEQLDELPEETEMGAGDYIDNQ